MLNGGVPYYNVYQTKDGGWLSVGAWRRTSSPTSATPSAATTSRPFQYDASHHDEIFRRFRERFLTKTRDEWFELLKDVDACVTPVHSLAEAVADAAQSRSGAWSSRWSIRRWGRCRRWESRRSCRRRRGAREPPRRDPASTPDEVLSQSWAERRRDRGAKQIWRHSLALLSQSRLRSTRRTGRALPTLNGCYQPLKLMVTLFSDARAWLAAFKRKKPGAKKLRIGDQQSQDDGPDREPGRVADEHRAGRSVRRRLDGYRRQPKQSAIDASPIPKSIPGMNMSTDSASGAAARPIVRTSCCTSACAWKTWVSST